MPQEVIIVVHLLNPGDLDRMHKLNLNKDKVNKLELTEIELLMLMEMGFFSNIKKMKKRVKSKPSSNQLHTNQQTPAVKKERFVDLHLEIVKKVDELIEGNDKDIKTRETEPVTKIQTNQLIPNTVELKESIIKDHESHAFQTELEFPKALGDLAQRQEFYEVVAPTPLTPDIIKVKEEDFTSRMVGNEDIKAEKTTQSIGKINFIRKSKEPKKAVAKNNGVTRTKNELEKTKAEIEAKKKELEEAIQKEKEKELELERKEVEKRKRKKIKELNLKKKMKEEKQKEKERELELKRKEEEKRKREKLRQQELKNKMKEEKQKEKERELELKRKEEEKRKREKLRQQELKEKMKEELKKEKLKEKKVEKKVKTKVVKKQEKPKEKKVKKPVKKEKQEKPIEKKKKIFKKKEEKEPEPLDTYIKDERPKEKEPEISEWDEDVEQLLPIIDKLFDKLPEDVVDEFAQSKGFNLYEKVLLKYKNK
jgi:hypothetical protein